MAGVGQHRERRGATALVSGHLGADVSVWTDVTDARRAALELGDHREAGAHQRLLERPILPAAGELGFQLGLRDRAFARIHPLPGACDQLVDDSHLS